MVAEYRKVGDPDRLWVQIRSPNFLPEEVRSHKVWDVVTVDILSQRRLEWMGMDSEVFQGW